MKEISLRWNSKVVGSNPISLSHVQHRCCKLYAQAPMFYMCIDHVKIALFRAVLHFIRHICGLLILKQNIKKPSGAV